ncbi:MAG: phage tail sheath subtilisin-like domain-containing protein [Acidobacteriota bacterium]
MPEYLAPGVYVEEVSFRSKSIEGVSTTTTGFIGPARYGPLDMEPDIITSLGEFKRVYGDGQQLTFGASGSPMHNYLWHAARGFFEEGGKRLYVVRVFRPRAGSNGVASANIGAGPGGISVRARFPGAAGNTRVRLALRIGQSILGGDPSNPSVGALRNDDIAHITDITSPITIGSPPGSGTFYRAESFFDAVTRTQMWRFVSPTAGTLNLNQLTPNLDPTLGDQVRVVTATVSVFSTEPGELPSVWEGLALDPDHERDGAPDSMSAKFAAEPSNLAQARTLPIVIELGSGLTTGLQLLSALLAANTGLAAALNDPQSSEESRSIDLELTGGNDGERPTAAEYEGEAEQDSTLKTGLKAFEDIEDVSIIAAPGSTFGLENGYRANATTIVNLLISHAARMRYRIAVLDSGDGQSISQVRAMRAKIDSTYAALYYPWVRVLDPITRSEIYLPPSGFIAGIYARNDVNRAVYKAPANEVVNLAIGFEQLLNKSQQDVLNPEGVNCFRFFEGRGFRVWGARTISSDPEWKYVNLRRYFAYLERSIDKGTQWAVFEPNGEALWANVRRTVEDFLLNEWMSGALLGDKPEKAYFVKCDRSTMTQNDLDNGRLICLIGVAPLRPAEFVIFRIGQWTADRKV